MRSTDPSTRRPRQPAGVTVAAVAAVAAFAAAAITTPSSADTATVTQLEDLVDFGGPRRIADLPGPDGLVSFREAVIAVNNTPGMHEILFAVAVDPGNPLGDLLRIDGSAFIVTRDGTRIDFLSQAIYLGDPDPDGPGLGMLSTNPSFLGQPALVIDASGCEVRGLGGTQFRESIVVAGGEGNRFIRNFTNVISLDPGFGGSTTGNIIGGTGPDDGNELEVVSIGCGADENIVIGNRVERIDVTGSPFCPEGFRYPTGNRIGGRSPAERNLVSGFGTYSGEGRPSGTGILVSFARQTTVEGNAIGVSEDGMSQAPDQNRGTTGIEIRDSIDTVVRGNHVAGIRGIGIAGFAGQVFGRAILVDALNDDVTGVVLEGNLVGTDATGTMPIPTRAGIEVIPGTASRAISDVRIGGRMPEAANVIAFTEGDGIRIAGADISGVEIAGNRIEANDGLGIDLRSSPSAAGGVTPNDTGDVDSGPNGFQNFPVLASASVASGGASIAGELPSEAGRTYRVELFASAGADASGHGEGQVLLGEVTVMTGADALAVFDFAIPAVPAKIAPGWVVTATATDVARRETSEFSAALPLEFDATCLGDLDESGDVGLGDLLAVLATWELPGGPADLDGSGVVGLGDVLLVLAAWGPCV